MKPSPQPSSRFAEPLVGSYPAEDCRFLLKPLPPKFHSVADKERLIQNGKLHYSQMIHREEPPSAVYEQLFVELTERHKRRLAAQILGLASAIATQQSGPITLLSLARAGTPIGVLLQRALRDVLQRQSHHYSVSIIRDRGIDAVALDYLLAQGHAPESICFIDGWTAKGVITRELKQAVADYNRRRGVQISDCLYVVSDIGGSADIAATSDDYAIPSGVMNATVSGLVSRSILNEQISADDFHGCVLYSHLAELDRSNWFIDQVTACFAELELTPIESQPRAQRAERAWGFLEQIMESHRVSDINRIKPGIAEATRVLLRRVPDLLMVRDPQDQDVAHLLRLASEKRVPVETVLEMPFGACALIRDVRQKGEQ